MLSITSDPLKSPMQVKRVQEAAPKMIEAQGKADYDFTTSIGHIGAAAMGAMFGKKARLYTYCGKTQSNGFTADELVERHMEIVN